MEAQPLLEARLISPGSWSAAGSEGIRSGLPLAARLPARRSRSRRPPARDLFAQSFPLGDARSRLKPFGEGRSSRGWSSSCRTIWLSLRRKSGSLDGCQDTWRPRSPPPAERERWGRGDPEEGEVQGAGRPPTRLRGGACHWTRLGWKWGERIGLASRDAGGERRKHSPAFLLRLTAPLWTLARTREPARCCFLPRVTFSFLAEV